VGSPAKGQLRHIEALGVAALAPDSHHRSVTVSSLGQPGDLRYSSSLLDSFCVQPELSYVSFVALPLIVALSRTTVLHHPHPPPIPSSHSDPRASTRQAGSSSHGLSPPSASPSHRLAGCCVAKLPRHVLMLLTHPYHRRPAVLQALRTAPRRAPAGTPLLTHWPGLWVMRSRIALFPTRGVPVHMVS
jgi:hypothetical protein